MGRRPRRKMENRLETKQMKLTTKILKEIIKEEIEKASSLKEGTYKEVFGEFQEMMLGFAKKYNLDQEDILALIELAYQKGE